MDKTTPITLNLAELTALAMDSSLSKHVSRKADKLVLDEHAAMAIRRLKAAQEILGVAERSFKEQLAAISGKRHINHFVGEGISVVIKPAVQFAVSPTYIRSWCTPKVTYSPNNDLIDSYIKINDALPEGVDLQESEPTVQISVKRAKGDRGVSKEHTTHKVTHNQTE